jgi:uncharacterized protein with HEPN domain
VATIQRRLAAPGGGLDPTRFFDDLEKQDAALRRLEILADSTGHLSEELKARYPEVQWRRITAFRNILAHAYLDLDLDRIWSTIVEDLPALMRVIEAEQGARDI